MKKISLFALSILFLLLGCKSNNNSEPQVVLKKFFDAIGDKNIDEAKKYVTQDSEGMLNMMQMRMQQMKDQSNNVLEYGKENVEYGKAVIDGDKALVPMKDKKSGEVTHFSLKKESGDWKVAFDKSTLMEMASKKMKEHRLDKIRNRKNDSLRNRGGAFKDIDSIRIDAMDRAKKMIDSAQKY